jgi:hypothetical protein
MEADPALLRGELDIWSLGRGVVPQFRMRRICSLLVAAGKRRSSAALHNVRVMPSSLPACVFNIARGVHDPPPSQAVYIIVRKLDEKSLTKPNPRFPRLD